MATKTYATRQKKTTTAVSIPSRTKTWDTTSSDLFDNLQVQEETIKESSPSSVVKQQSEKPRKFAKGVNKGQSSAVGKSPLSDSHSSNGQLKQNQSTRTYKYSYSPRSALSSASTHTITTSQVKPSVKSLSSAVAMTSLPPSANKEQKSFRKLQPPLEKAPRTDNLKIFDFDFSDDDDQQEVGVVSTKAGVVKKSALVNSKASLKKSTGTGSVTINKKTSSATVVTKNGHLAKQRAKSFSKTSPTLNQTNNDDSVAMETSESVKTDTGVARNLKRKGSCTLNSSDKSVVRKKVKLAEVNTRMPKTVVKKSTRNTATQSVSANMTDDSRIAVMSGIHGDSSGIHGDSSGIHGDLYGIHGDVSVVGRSGARRKRKDMIEGGVVISEIAKRTRSASRSGLSDAEKGGEGDNKESSSHTSHTRTLMTSIIATRTRSTSKDQQQITMTTEKDSTLSGESMNAKAKNGSSPSLSDHDIPIQSSIKTMPSNTRQAQPKRLTPLSQTTSGSNFSQSASSEGQRSVKSDTVMSVECESGLLSESPLSGVSTTASSANSKLNSTVQTSKLELQPDDPNLVDLTDTETMEESPDLSLSEPADGPAFKVDFNRHLVKTNPQLRKSSSYSLSSGPSPRPSLSPTKHSPTLTPLSQSSSSLRQPPSKGVPSLKKSSSWPNKQFSMTNKNRSPSGLVRSLFSGGGPSSTGGVAVGVASNRDKGEKPLVTVVRNVRQAHECLEIGESQQFFDEAHYLLDSMRPSRPLNARCLSTCNLAIQYLDSEFSQQLRAHSFTSKITALLKDCLEHPPLCLSTAVLFYIMTRDKLNSEWNKTGTELLINMLSMDTTPTSTHSGKTAREMAKIEKKARTILKKYQDKHSRNSASPSVAKQPSASNVSPEKAASEDVPAITVSGEENGASGGVSKVINDGTGEQKEENKEQIYMVNTDNISISELAHECLLSLTSSHHNPHWLREELRIAGGLDILANMVISCCDGLSQVDATGLSGAGGDYVESVCARIAVLARQLKCLENVTLGNKDNQSYCVVFDGSMLISILMRMFSLLQEFIKHDSLRYSTQDCLIAIFKFFLNVTHDNQLGCHRIGEQRGVMDAILKVAFQLTKYLPEESRFDVTVLVLGLLVNLTEHSNNNRKQLESTTIDYYGNSDQNEPKDELKLMEQDIRGCHGDNSSLRALICLFLTHYSKAESANIEVPTPQRLSQLSTTPMSSPQRGDQAKSDLSNSFADRMKSSRTPQKLPHRDFPSSSNSSQDNDNSQRSKSSDKDGTNWLSEQVLETTSKEVGGGEDDDQDEEDEEFESIQTDPLVFSREEFDAALHQAGQHMEDSIVASYSALLLGILVRHNQDSVDMVRNCMPSKTFSEMIGILKKFVSFMNMAGSLTGLDSIRHIIKYLEAL